MMIVDSIDELGSGKSSAELLIFERSAGHLSLPLTVIRGRASGPTLLVIAGVHPTEYAGIEAALRLANDVQAEQVTGAIVIVPFVNLLGFNSRMPGGCPEDMVDLFRIFPGDAGSSVSYTIAREVFQRLVLKSNFVVDLHGGELNESEAIPLAWYSVTGNAKVDAQSKNLAAAFGPDFLLDISKVWFDDQPAPLPAGLLIHEAAKRGVPAIIGEAGGAGKSSDLGADRLYSGLLNLCRSLGILNGTAQTVESSGLKDLSLLGVKQDGLLYCKVSAGQSVSKGQLLAEVRHWNGATLQQIEAPFDGIVTITVNWLPVRSGEYALAVARQT